MRNKLVFIRDACRVIADSDFPTLQGDQATHVVYVYQDDKVYSLADQEGELIQGEHPTGFSQYVEDYLIPAEQRVRAEREETAFSESLKLTIKRNPLLVICGYSKNGLGTGEENTTKWTYVENSGKFIAMP